LLGGFVKGNLSLRMRFIGFDIEFVGVNIVKFQVSEFANTDTGLEEKFNNGIDADVIAADVS